MPHVRPSSLKGRAAELEAEGIAAPEWSLDGYFGRASVESFLAMLRQLPPGVSEVMTHPGYVDEALRELGGGYVDQRVVELQVLLDPRVRAAMADLDIEPASYACLAPPR